LAEHEGNTVVYWLREEPGQLPGWCWRQCFSRRLHADIFSSARFVMQRFLRFIDQELISHC